MYVLGIDPGKLGGLALINESKVIECHKMPETPYQLIALIKEMTKDKEVIFAVEQVHSMPKQGVVSTFTFGFNYGVLLGIIMMLSSRLEHIKPQEWKKYFKIVGKMSPTQAKNDSIMVINNRYPETRYMKYHSGIFDAILIASYYADKIEGKNANKQ